MSKARLRCWALLAVAGGLAALPAAAAAQELSFGFTNPSFGGNPFYSAHLLGVAEAQRPDRPTASSQLSQTQLFAQQLQSRLLSALSAGLTNAITGSKAGDSGEFVIGDQKISFENTGTEIKVTIVNQVTGETTEITVPVFNFANATGASGGGGATTSSAASPEAALGQMLARTQASGTSGSSAGSSEIPPTALAQPPL
jgi:curli production assembly/transport component CsgF